MKYSLALLFVLISAGCEAPPSYSRMSETELAAYNESRPAEQKVYCVSEANTSTYIRRRSCRTAEEWVQLNESNAMTLEVLSTPNDFQLPGVGPDGPIR